VLGHIAVVLNIATFAYFKALEEFEKHLPPSLDSELLVLKGHLLVEELLEVYLWNNLANPRELEDARESISGTNIAIQEMLVELDRPDSPAFAHVNKEEYRAKLKALLQNVIYFRNEMLR
jgi:hypothetical protein